MTLLIIDMVTTLSKKLVKAQKIRLNGNFCLFYYLY